MHLDGAAVTAAERIKSSGAGPCACRELLEYLANTLIFVLAGVIIAGRIW